MAVKLHSFSDNGTTYKQIVNITFWPSLPARVAPSAVILLTEPSQQQHGRSNLKKMST
jgi:hypothetical protein